MSELAPEDMLEWKIDNMYDVRLESVNDIIDFRKLVQKIFDEWKDLEISWDKTNLIARIHLLLQEYIDIVGSGFLDSLLDEVEIEYLNHTTESAYESLDTATDDDYADFAY